mgnify:FL=1|jgi:hypothetical protein|tara:strand:+ start:103 stop:423 length:321 start_codon:yes stop_codon:yes gene_type:complete
MDKIDALTKNLLYEKVAVIHAAFEDAPTTVAFVEVKKDATINEKLEEAFVKTNSINDGWWNNEGVTKMFGGAACRSTSNGDMVLIGKDKYVCGMAGWNTLDGEIVR